ncbi:unnamed protein product [Diamesa serratosioi]
MSPCFYGYCCFCRMRYFPEILTFTLKATKKRTNERKKNDCGFVVLGLYSFSQYNQKIQQQQQQQQQQQHKKRSL